MQNEWNVWMKNGKMSLLDDITLLVWEGSALYRERKTFSSDVMLMTSHITSYWNHNISGRCLVENISTLWRHHTYDQGHTWHGWDLKQDTTLKLNGYILMTSHARSKAHLIGTSQIRAKGDDSDITNKVKGTRHSDDITRWAQRTSQREPLNA